MTTEVLGSFSFAETPTVGGSPVLLNAGGITSISADITANRPAAGIAGRIFLDTTLNKFYLDDGAVWIDLTSVPLIDGTANQITVVDGTNVTPSVVSIADNPILPGTASFRPPSGTTAQRPVGVAGDMRFNSTNALLEKYTGAYWGPLGLVLQQVTGTIAAASGTTTVPLDNTAPTSTEGWQIFTQAFTPISATSRIIIEFGITSSHSAGTGTNILSLFAGTTNIGTVAGRTDSAANTAVPLRQKKVYAPGSTAAITFSARLGNPTAGTSYCNQIGANTLGGTLVSNYIITEVE
jgi:hypothetical protein